MNRSYLVASVMVLALALPVACKSKKPQDPGNTVKKPDPTVKVEAEADPESRPKAKPDASAIPGEPIKPKEKLAWVTIRMVNRSKKDRFTQAGRSFWDALDLARFTDGKWVSVYYRLRHCENVCPADGSKPASCPCHPARPAIGRIPAKSSLEKGWQGLVYYSRQLSPSCYCRIPRKAPHGRYRATACVYPGAGGDLSPADKAKKTPHYMLDRRATSGEKICSSVEFEHSDKDQTVEISIKK